VGYFFRTESGGGMAYMSPQCIYFIRFIGLRYQIFILQIQNNQKSGDLETGVKASKRRDPGHLIGTFWTFVIETKEYFDNFIKVSAMKDLSFSMDSLYICNSGILVNKFK
jgi:hypothetical protein